MSEASNDRVRTYMGSSPRSGCGCKKSWTLSLCFLLKSHRGHRLGARAMQPVRARCREMSVPHRHFGATCVHLVLTVRIRLRASRALLDSCGWCLCPAGRKSHPWVSQRCFRNSSRILRAVLWVADFISVSESLRSTAVPFMAASLASLSANSFLSMPVCEGSHIRNTSEPFSISWWARNRISACKSPRFLVPPAASAYSTDFESDRIATPRGGFGKSFTMVHVIYMAYNSSVNMLIPAGSL